MFHLLRLFIIVKKGDLRFDYFKIEHLIAFALQDKWPSEY